MNRFPFSIVITAVLFVGGGVDRAQKCAASFLSLQ